MAMTEQERQAKLDEAFPSTIGTDVRPADVQPDFPYSESFPSFMSKDKVLFSLTNLIIEQMLSNDKSLKDQLDALVNRFASADIQLVTQTLKGLMSPADKIKLDGLSNYTHPASGVSPGTYSKVTVNNLGHVTLGNNPTTLAGYGITDAAKKEHGNHVPTTEPANNTRFLRNDNTWQTITPAMIGAVSTVYLDKFIITGTARHGTQLPVPDGAKREDCVYYVSLNHFEGSSSDNKYTFDQYISVNSNGIVTCYVRTTGRNSTGGTYYGYVNYLVIAKGVD